MSDSGEILYFLQATTVNQQDATVAGRVDHSLEDGAFMVWYKNEDTETGWAANMNCLPPYERYNCKFYRDRLVWEREWRDLMAQGGTLEVLREQDPATIEAP